LVVFRLELDGRVIGDIRYKAIKLANFFAECSAEDPSFLLSGLRGIPRRRCVDPATGEQVAGPIGRAALDRVTTRPGEFALPGFLGLSKAVIEARPL
jgi:hypothetical protein